MARTRKKKSTAKKQPAIPAAAEMTVPQSPPPPAMQDQAITETTALEPSFITDVAVALKDLLRQQIDSFKNDIHPEKAAFFKKELAGILKAGSVCALVIVAVSALLIVAELHFSGKIFANTSVAGINVGSLTTDQARARLLVEIEQYVKTPLTFSYEDQKATLSPEELGVHFALDQTINATPAVRFQDINPLLLSAAFLTKRNIPLQYSLDTDKAVRKLEEKFHLTDKRARNARLVIKDGEFIIENEASGMTIKEAALLKSLRQNLAGLQTAALTLEAETEQPRITAQELAGQKDHLIGLLKNQLTLTHDDEELKIKPAEHLDAVQFGEKTLLRFKDSGLTMPLALGDAHAGGASGATVAADSPVEIVSKLEIQFQPEKMAPYLQENLLKNIEVPTSGVAITREENGTIKIEGKGEDGKTVPKKRLIAGINLAANNGISSVPVPVTTEKAPVNIAEDLQQLGIKELLTTGHTSYYGSPPNRMHNINVGIAKYNGVLVKPGEEFSFNKLLGEVDGKNGYLPEKVIKKNKLELEYGGGICQVSTTLYRALLLAGLPITERNPHSWKVSYYGQVLGHGLDATIYPGVSDVKFMNDTPGHLLIQAYSEGANAYFKFYGTSDGRTAELDGPYGGGLHYKWYRTVKKNGEELKETIVSNYKPIPPPEPPPAPPPKPIAQNAPTI